MALESVPVPESVRFAPLRLLAMVRSAAGAFVVASKVFAPDSTTASGPTVTALPFVVTAPSV